MTDRVTRVEIDVNDCDGDDDNDDDAVCDVDCSSRFLKAHVHNICRCVSRTCTCCCSSTKEGRVEQSAPSLSSIIYAPPTLQEFCLVFWKMP